ncbi:hypothetical protein BU16DRAFT_587114 [Lophium mytilinum]|uniref:Uncharacterized protein n=1 Tax=Lophium mytilinum TaxID=390894 RepID=A0A6A6Q7C1_9PEZI|nr:hypothetical protein BU16DRAFT_587114 [Lophium mytilinum]
MRISPFRVRLDKSLSNVISKHQLRRVSESSNIFLPRYVRRAFWETFDPTEGATNPRREQRLQTLVENRIRFEEWYEPFRRVDEGRARLYEVLTQCPFPVLLETRSIWRPGNELDRDFLHIRRKLYPVLEDLQSEKYRGNMKIRHDAASFFELAIESSESTEQAFRSLMTQSPNKATLEKIFSQYLLFGDPYNGVSRKLWGLHKTFNMVLRTSMKGPSSHTGSKIRKPGAKRPTSPVTGSDSHGVGSKFDQASSDQFATWVQELKLLKELQRNTSNSEFTSNRSPKLVRKFPEPPSTKRQIIRKHTSVGKLVRKFPEPPSTERQILRESISTPESRRGEVVRHTLAPPSLEGQIFRNYRSKPE